MEIWCGEGGFVEVGSRMELGLAIQDQDLTKLFDLWGTKLAID